MIIQRAFLRLLKFFLKQYNLSAVNSNSIFELGLSKIIKHNKINIVFDVGAGSGNFIRLIRSHGYKGKVFAFEPVEESFSRLLSNIKPLGNCECYRIAAGAEDKRTRMNVAKNLESSSLLPILPQHLESAPDSYSVRAEEVEVKRLGNFCKGMVKTTDRIFLKVDVQGAEKEVLSGAENILPLVSLIQLELSIVPLYQGQVLYQDMFKLMQDYGYRLVFLTPIFFDPVSGDALQFDAVFKRAQE